MARVDLDAARTAREETVGDVVATFGGRDYRFKSTVSFDAGEAWRNNDAPAFLRAVLVDPDETEAFLATPGVGWADLNGIWDAWKAEPGEQSAS